MCDCKKTIGFAEKLAEAKKLTQQTGDNYVVYVHKSTDTVWVKKEADLTDALGICCYFLSDGTEVVYTPAVNSMEVVEQEVVKAPKRGKK